MCGERTARIRRTIRSTAAAARRMAAARRRTLITVRDPVRTWSVSADTESSAYRPYGLAPLLSMKAADPIG